MTRIELECRFAWAVAAACHGHEPGPGINIHIDRGTTDEDWAALDPNSLESDCRDCGAYIELHWSASQRPPEQIRCPNCGSTNHGAVGSPAGGMHAALWDSRLP